MNGGPVWQRRMGASGTRAGYLGALLPGEADQTLLSEFAPDSALEEGGFEPLVPSQSQHNRGTGPMSPTSSIPVANSISNLSQVGPAVRIRFPPAGSLLRTGLDGTCATGQCFDRYSPGHATGSTGRVPPKPHAGMAARCATPQPWRRCTLIARVRGEHRSERRAASE
jgi:hypothetical protein